MRDSSWLMTFAMAFAWKGESSCLDSLDGVVERAALDAADADVVALEVQAQHSLEVVEQSCASR